VSIYDDNNQIFVFISFYKLSHIVLNAIKFSFFWYSKYIQTTFIFKQIQFVVIVCCTGSVISEYYVLILRFVV